jgi:hypothetical protein
MSFKTLAVITAVSTLVLGAGYLVAVAVVVALPAGADVRAVIRGRTGAARTICRCP